MAGSTKGPHHVAGGFGHEICGATLELAPGSGPAEVEAFIYYDEEIELFSFSDSIPDKVSEDLRNM